MVRVEIFANHSIEADLFERLEARSVAKHYSLVPIVHGVGHSGPRRGDQIWPEENLMLIVYCSPKEAMVIDAVVQELQEEFPDEGVAIFSVKS